ncbi:uncharacterized protein LOC119798664 isoform X2 [Cyprinodon tularosa]|uniref:uncharacterized protein LOC119798664 isoform X2 n=1 Tax=Cyprinodon tularosa TaxID=77115 RepID=UPI0018E20A74|nr:uncharacterized protein LOC119798664 isoform X2 [Cyprinodon tularosa]
MVSFLRCLSLGLNLYNSTQSTVTSSAAVRSIYNQVSLQNPGRNPEGENTSPLTQTEFKAFQLDLPAAKPEMIIKNLRDMKPPQTAAGSFLDTTSIASNAETQKHGATISAKTYQETSRENNERIDAEATSFPGEHHGSTGIQTEPTGVQIVRNINVKPGDEYGCEEAKPEADAVG